SPRGSSTMCSCRRCGRRFRPTSTSTSLRTIAASSAHGRASRPRGRSNSASSRGSTELRRVGRLTRERADRTVAGSLRRPSERRRAMTTPMAERLGKLPVRTDVRTLSLAQYVDSHRLPSPPPVLDEASGVGAWPLYKNDRIGNCTVAAAAHMIEAWTAACRGEPEVVSERSVLAAFEHVKTLDPDSGEEGAVELDVLRLWRKSGIGRHRIGAYARVPVHELAL